MQRGLQGKKSSAKKLGQGKSFSQNLATKYGKRGALGVLDRKNKRKGNLPNKFLFPLDCT